MAPAVWLVVKAEGGRTHSSLGALAARKAVPLMAGDAAPGATKRCALVQTVQCVS